MTIAEEHPKKSTIEIYREEVIEIFEDTKV